MPDIDYTNREVDEKFKTLHEKLDLILYQTTRTNGRVSKLENWRWFITGGLGIVTFIVIPMVVYIFNYQVNHIFK